MTAILAATSPGRGLVSQGAPIIAVLTGGVAVGVALAWLPIIVLLPILALGVVLLAVSAPFRTAFLVFGGLAVLQSSEELSLIKVGYLLGAGVAFVAALFNLRSLEATRSYRLLRPVLGLSLLFASLAGLSMAVSIAHGTPVTAWLRDAAPYFLLASVPVFALDLKSSTPKRLLVAMFVTAGALASLSFTLEWLDRRTFADLHIDRIALPSGQLRSALYLYALSGTLLARENRAGWGAFSAVILSLTWITGNRVESLLLVLAAPVAAVFAAKREQDVLGPAVRLLTVGCAAVLLTVVLAQALATFGEYDTERLSGRFGSVTTVLSNPETDTSYQDREAQTLLGWRTFLSEPVSGIGPGHIFEWTTARGLSVATFHLDTGLSFLSKFGTVGMAMLLALVIAYASFLRNAGRGSWLTVPQVALVGYGALALLAMPFSTPLEDKGFSFGLLFLLALSLPEEREADRPGPTCSPVPGGGAR